MKKPQFPALSLYHASVESLESRRLLASALKGIVSADNELAFENYLPQTRLLHRSGGFLTKPDSGAALDVALAYLRTHAAELGVSARDLESPIVTDQYTDAHNGVTHIYLRQEFNGLPVINADLSVHVMPDGRILSVGGGFVPGLGAKETPNPNLVPALSATRALDLAARQLNLGRVEPAAIKTLSRARGIERLTTLQAASVSLDAIPAKLAYVATETGVELAWEFVLRTPGDQHWYHVAVGDQAQAVVFATDWIDDASYNAIERPAEHPQDGPAAPNRTLLVDPHDALASPFGWHDTNGAAGAEFTDTRGNNVSAQEDIDFNNSGGTRPSGGAALNFDFPLDLTQQPSAYRPAAITNLFYWNNLLHDIHYRYGFTEQAGNFQTNTYGRGGAGNDAVQADAQDGEGFNNANFGTPPDGSAGRMQMFVFNLTSPNRDGDLDNGIIVHEYGHGVSNRLTGGPANASALTSVQSGGMGEGWSDFWSLLFLQRATDSPAAAYPMGTYALGQPADGPGIRRTPYSFDRHINPITIDAYGAGGISSLSGGMTRATLVHSTGNIWASVLWDLNWILINKYGFEPAIQNGYNPGAVRGNTLTLQLVMDALKLQPANPSFTQARDAILSADTALTGGANQNEIRVAFARRGMGTGFSTASSSSTSVTPSFDGPTFFVVNSTPGTTIKPTATLDINFNKPVDSSTFSLADDVISFTGPGGADLLSLIGSASFVDSDTLRISFPAVSAIGSYTVTIGPDIHAAAGGPAMDNDFDLVAGGSSDGYSATFTYATKLGPDAASYFATPYPYQSVDLVAGQPGVITLLDNQNNTATSISLAGNTFTLYGVTYAGSLFANENGLLTFGGSSTSSTNGELTSNPSFRSIAVLWDDWLTNVSTTDQVLARFDDLTGDTVNDRLIIEWSDVRHSTSTGNGVTFQAILQLNTGSAPGRIILNYVDLETGVGSLSNGGSATVGIKGTGTTVLNRLLLSQNDNTNPWIGSGRAVLYATDVVAPQVLQAGFEYLTTQAVRYTFDDDVSASLAASDLVIEDLTHGGTIAPANINLSYDAGSNTASFTFDTLLPDARYRATLVTAGITDPPGNPLDGNGDQFIGGDHVFEFFVLAGDANRDRAVDITDLGILATNWQQSPRDFSQGDLNYDGVVDISDLGLLATNWQASLPAPFAYAAISSSSSPSRAGEDNMELAELL